MIRMAMSFGDFTAQTYTITGDDDVGRSSSSVRQQPTTQSRSLTLSRLVWRHLSQITYYRSTGASWIYTGRNSLPMTRYAPALGSHFYLTLFAAAVCHSLDISFTPTLGRIITELLRRALWTLLVIGDGGLVAPDNPGSEPWRRTCGQWISD